MTIRDVPPIPDATEWVRDGQMGQPGHEWAAQVNKILGEVKSTTSTNVATSGLNKQTGTSYTFVLTDAGKIVEFENASAVTVTIPPNSSVAFEYPATNGNCARIDIAATGAGIVTIQGGSGVTLRSAGSATDLRTQYAAATLYQRAKDEWLLAGDIA